MIIDIVIPEYTATMAMTEWWDARFLRREMQAELGDQVDTIYTFLPCKSLTFQLSSSNRLA